MDQPRAPFKILVAALLHSFVNINWQVQNLTFHFSTLLRLELKLCSLSVTFSEPPQCFVLAIPRFSQRF